MDVVEEQLGVIGPHVATCISYSSCDAEGQHGYPGKDEDLQQEYDPLQRSDLLGFADGAVSLRVPLPLRLLNRDEDYRRRHQAEDAAEEEDPVPVQGLLDPVPNGKGKAVAEIDAPVVDAEGSATELLQFKAKGIP